MVEVDVGDDGMLATQFMRVKVKIRVVDLIMRGQRLDLDKKDG